MTPSRKDQDYGRTPKDADGMPAIKQEDMKFFNVLLEEVNEKELSPQEYKERKILMLLLKVKNGTPQMRKAALRQLT
jgi:splicing factor 3B subunit 1